MTEIVAAIRAVDALLALLANAGITIQKIQSLREQNADGHLTDEQVNALADQARESVRRLG